MKLTIPYEMRFFDSSFCDLIFKGKLHMPSASIRINKGNEAYIDMPTVTNFSISLDRSNPLSTFTFNISKASEWNPRLKTDLLVPYIGNEVEIFYGRGDIQSIQVMIGLIRSVSESYVSAATNSINISGVNLARRLELSKDLWSSDEYTGYSKALVEYWCEQAGIEYALSFTDYLSLTSFSLSYQNALAGLNDMRTSWGPDVEAYIDSFGKLIVRDVAESSPEFYYDETDITQIDIVGSSEDVYTKVEVTGATDPIYAEAIASSSYLSKYGTVTFSIFTSLVETQTHAERLADAYLREGLRQGSQIKFTSLLNPYLTVGSVISIKDSRLSGIGRQSVRVTKITHGFTSNRNHSSTVEGYFI